MSSSCAPRVANVRRTELEVWQQRSEIFYDTEGESMVWALQISLGEAAHAWVAHTVVWRGWAVERRQDAEGGAAAEESEKLDWGWGFLQAGKTRCPCRCLVLTKYLYYLGHIHVCYDSESEFYPRESLCRLQMVETMQRIFTYVYFGPGILLSALLLKLWCAHESLG